MIAPAAVGPVPASGDSRPTELRPSDRGFLFERPTQL